MADFDYSNLLVTTPKVEGDTDSADRTELLKSIASASDEPIKPTKWNSQETRSPREILTEELQKQLSQGTTTPDDTNVENLRSPGGSSSSPSFDYSALTPKAAQAPTPEAQTPDYTHLVPQPETLGQQLGGGTAAVADFVTAVPQMIGAGLGGLAKLAMSGGDIKAAAEQVEDSMQKTTPSNVAVRLGVPKEYVQNKAYETASSPANWLSNKAAAQAVGGVGALGKLATGGSLEEATKFIHENEDVPSMVQNVEGKAGFGAGLATNIASQFLPFVLLGKAAESASNATIKVNVDKLREIRDNPSVNPINQKPVEGIPLDKPRPGEPELPLQLELPIDQPVTPKPHITAKMQPRQMSFEGFQELEAQSKMQEVQNIKQQILDIIGEQPRPTAMEVASARDALLGKGTSTGAMAQLGELTRKQRGSIDPDLLGVGAVTRFMDSIKDFELDEQQRRLLTAYTGTFDRDSLTRLFAKLRDPKSKETMVQMRPEDFLTLAAERSTERFQLDEPKRESVRRGLETKSGLDALPVKGERYGSDSSIPVLEIRTDPTTGEAQVISHNGRNRMDVFKEKQMDMVPVRLIETNGEVGPWSRRKSPLSLLQEDFEDRGGNAVSMPQHFSSPPPMSPILGGVGKAGFKQGGAIAINVFDSAQKDAHVTRPEGDESAPWWKNFYNPNKQHLVVTGFAPGNNPAPKTSAVLGRMIIPADKFISTFQKLFGKDIDLTKTEYDIWYNEIGLTTDTFQTMNRLISDDTRPGQWIVKYAWDMLKNHNELEHQMNLERRGASVALNDVYGLGKKIPGSFKADRLQHNVKALLEWEEQPSTWFDGSNYHPTADMMRKAGFTEDEIGAWNKVFDVQDKNWQVMEAACKMADRPVPERIPGQMPHVWRGRYQVMIKPVGSDSPVGILAGHKLEEATAYLNSARKLLADRGLGEQFTVTMDLPKTIGDDVNETLQGLFRAKSIAENSPQILKLIQDVYNSATKGLITSALERKDITAFGHQLERVRMSDGTISGEMRRFLNKYLYTDKLGITKPDPTFGLTRAQLKQAVQIMNKSSEALVGWYTRAKFVNEVLTPLDKAGMLPAGSKVANFVQTAMSTWLGIPDKILKQLNFSIRDDLIRSGRDPQLGDIIGNMINSGFAKFYLFFNFRYYITNSLSGLGPAFTLFSYKALGHAYNEPVGSILKASMDFMTGKDAAMLKEAANQLGKSNPSFLENLDPGHLKDPVAGVIEHQTREKAFMLGYHYFKQIMDSETALRTAGEFANLSTVPFDPYLGRPMLFSALPDVLKAGTLFATFQNHMISMAAMTGRILSESVKAKNPTAVANALTGALMLQATNVALYGLQGGVMVPMYNDVANAINYFVGAPIIPNTTWIGRRIGQALHSEKAGQIFSYGGLSTALNYDVSSSGRGAVGGVMGIGMDAIHSALALALLGGRKLASTLYDGVTKPSNKDWWNEVKTLPSSRTGTLEYLMKQPFGDIIKQLKGEIPDYSVGVDPETGAQDPSLRGIKRTPEGTLIRFLFGLKSLREAEQQETAVLTAKEKNVVEEQAKRNLQLLREGNLSKQEQSKLILDLASKAYKNPDDIVNALIDYRLSGTMTDSQRRAMGSQGSLEAMYWFLRWNQIKQTEPTRTQGNP